MPTVLRVGRFRFFVYSNEGNEPPHIHVKAAEHEAKYWLDSMQLADNYGFNGRELTQIEQIIPFYESELMEAWHDHLDDTQ